MTLDNILDEFELKYLITKINKKDVRKTLKRDSNYFSFIEILTALLKRQNAYVFEIGSKMKYIIKMINNKVESDNREMTADEEELTNYFNSILNISYEKRLDYKSQYERICESNCFPGINFTEYSFDDIAHINYYNFYMYLESKQKNYNQILLKDNKSFLITTNELLSNYSDYLDEDTLDDLYYIVKYSDYKETSFKNSMASLINQKITLKKITKIKELKSKKNRVLKKQ